MNDDRATVMAMLEMKRTARGPATSVLGLWLTRRAKSFWPRWAGWKWFHKTNMEMRWNIVAYHHPACLCWSWFVSLSFRRRDVQWRHPRNWVSLKRRYGNGPRFMIPWLFEISFHYQRSDWMLSGDAEMRLREFAFAEESLAA